MDILKQFKKLAKKECIEKKISELPFVDPKHVFSIEPAEYRLPKDFRVEELPKSDILAEKRRPRYSNGRYRLPWYMVGIN